MKSKTFFFFAFLFVFADFIVASNIEDSFTINLGGEWNLKNANGSISIKGNVPGDIFGDLMAAQVLKEEPYYRFNDLNFRWVPLDNWTYSRSFTVDSSESNSKAILWMEGLDTIATVQINGMQVLASESMFVRHQVDISSLLKYGQSNEITVAFSNAVSHMEKKAKEYPYPVDSTDPPIDVYHGIPHRNFIRKEQSSFGWDWGPAFLPQGIYKPIGIKTYQDAFLNYVAPEIVPVANDLSEFSVKVKAFVRGIPQKTVELSAVLNGQKNSKKFVLTSDIENELVLQFNVKRPELWWPRNYGSPKLYDLNVNLADSNGKIVDKSSQKVGFKKVRLVTDEIQDQKGTNWMYFEVNNVPIFSKGANWIPSDSFAHRVNDSNVEELLISTVEANMNIVRVWGGGIYQRDSFYSTCDRLGLMVWQEFMFACAMYPRDKNFLKLVKDEVKHQIRRLSHHASIVMWSGNNENEVALTWGNITPKNRDLYLADYSVLYYDTIYEALQLEDVSRPFWPSSPSNGYTSMVPLTGFWKDTGNVSRGDVHFYNYEMNCNNVENFPKAKFVSEYGFQSHESLQSYLSVTLPSDRSRNSPLMKHRQHHPNGNPELEAQVAREFKLGKEEVGDQQFSSWSYLTQSMQSFCIKSETEHYRRGKGMPQRTMGAIYWQLNSIWQAPTWSSLEYGGRWKMLHYFVKRFFETFLVSSYEDMKKNTLSVHFTSDSVKPVRGNVRFELRNWSDEKVVNSFNKSFSLESLQSKEVYAIPIAGILKSGKREGLFMTITAFGDDGNKLSENFHFFSSLKDVNLPKANVSFSSFTQVDQNTVKFTVSTDAPSPYTWIASSLEGKFDDNGILLLKSSPRTIVFTSKWPVVASDLSKSLSVQTIRGTY